MLSDLSLALPSLAGLLVPQSLFQSAAHDRLYSLCISLHIWSTAHCQVQLRHGVYHIIWGWRSFNQNRIINIHTRLIQWIDNKATSSTRQWPNWLPCAELTNATFALSLANNVVIQKVTYASCQQMPLTASKNLKCQVAVSE